MIQNTPVPTAPDLPHLVILLTRFEQLNLELQELIYSLGIKGSELKEFNVISPTESVPELYYDTVSHLEQQLCMLSVNKNYLLDILNHFNKVI